MFLMLSKIYKALIVAGVPEKEAREATEELVRHHIRLNELEAGVRVGAWMLGILIIGVALLGIKIFSE